MKTSWHQIAQSIMSCQKCGLCATRSTVVIGEGNRTAALMLVGEGPGFQEDRQGRPFVGPAGELLTKMLKAIQMDREQVYITNIVKCRPPQNRTPTEEEAHACLNYLRAQFALVRPEVIIALGATAAKYLIHDEIRITRDRGKWVQKNGIWIMPTFHPAALLRDAEKKRPVWEDLQNVHRKLQEIPAQLDQDS